MREILYNREEAVSYARKWALGRNPAYFDFQKLGGDCTNFASQCIYAHILSGICAARAIMLHGS